MNNIWSEKIQGIKTLYFSRKLRFDDFFASRYKELFKIEQKPGVRIIEIGCGPGALAGALHRWYPEAAITAIDRDTNFISFAKENEPGIAFTEADAAALPFADGSFDVTVSHTVCEHVEPGTFWGEQFRVLRSGGLCICLTVDREKSKSVKAPCLAETEEERLFWSQIMGNNDDFEKYDVGKYYVSEETLAAQAGKYGFRGASVGHIAIDLSPESLELPDGLAERIIEAGRQSDIEAVLSTGSEKAPAVAKIINEKYDLRLKLLREGKKQGDISHTVITAIVCIKP